MAYVEKDYNEILPLSFFSSNEILGCVNFLHILSSSMIR